MSVASGAARDAAPPARAVRRAALARARTLEWFSLGWNAIEALIAIAAALAAGSVALFGFGCGSQIVGGCRRGG